MNKVLVSALIIFSLTLSGCKWFNSDQIKSDLINAKENVEDTVEKVGTTVKETKENVENAIEEVKETTAEIKEAVKSVKEAKDAVDEAFGKVKNIGSEEQTEAEPMSANE